MIELGLVFGTLEVLDGCITISCPEDGEVLCEELAGTAAQVLLVLVEGVVAEALTIGGFEIASEDCILFN